MHTIKKGDELTLDIDSLAFGGRGIARYDECVLFVKNAIPGQKVKALVYRKKRDMLKPEHCLLFMNLHLVCKHHVFTLVFVEDARFKI